MGDQGANIALVSKLHAGVADDAYAFTLNNYCVSGLTAIGHAATQVAAGNLDRALAGGVEMMSRVPFLGDNASYYTDASFPKRTRFIPVVLAADRLAEAEGISREQLDAVALVSQQRAGAAEANPALTASRMRARWPGSRRMRPAAVHGGIAGRDAAELCGSGRAVRGCARRPDRSSPHDRSRAADL